jgi:uncharacterized protein (DUF2237 family)
MPEAQKNILGLPLVPCSLQPRTGFFRTGCCETGPEDRGLHVVCVVVTEPFLTFSRERGNDLSTPRPEHGFPGLRAGDRWCLCASRWQEALEAGKAPPVVLASTHEGALRVIERSELLAYAVDGGSLN